MAEPAKEPETTMIDTTETPRRTPMLKLGKKRFTAARPIDPTAEQEETKSLGTSSSAASLQRPSTAQSLGVREQTLECPFRECGRKFASDNELRNHMQRRHRPAPTLTQEAAKTTVVETKSIQETPVPIRSKVEFTATGTKAISTTATSTSAASKPSPQTFIEAGRKQQQHEFVGAKPKVVQQRPGTAAAGGSKMPSQQVDMLRAMMHMQPGPRKGQSGLVAQRPKTAATSTVYDEKRIKDKLKYLDNIFDKLDVEVQSAADNIDLDFFRGKRNPALVDPKAKQNGVKLTRKMVQDNSLMCEEMNEVTTLMLRDKRINYFDDNLEDKDEEGNVFKLVEMCNLECLMASHNLIGDITGILQLTTLVELNLSYNMITDIVGIEELTQLKSLYLNHNKISTIESLTKLLNLKQLGLFYNDLIDVEHAMSVLMRCTKLRELSIDGNECARAPEFGYELLMRLPDLRVLNEEAVKELDRDVAQQYYEMYELPVPTPYKPQAAVQNKLRGGEDDLQDGSKARKEKKCVRFSEVDADDIEECGHEKDLKNLHAQIQQLELDKYQLEQRLTATKYDEVYNENERLKVQLNNMFELMEENEQMRTELEAMKSCSFDERTAQTAEDNKRLKRRNGELQFELMSAKTELKKLKDSMAHLPSGASAQQQALLMGAGDVQLRPQTAAVRSKPFEEEWLADPTFDPAKAQDDMDRELAEIMQRNQKRLAELHSELKVVSKLTEEPYANVRKVKQPAVMARRRDALNREGAVDEKIDEV